MLGDVSTKAAELSDSNDLGVVSVQLKQRKVGVGSNGTAELCVQSDVRLHKNGLLVQRLHEQ